MPEAIMMDPRASQMNGLVMPDPEWCLECHRAPERFLRPKDEVYNFAWFHSATVSAVWRF